MQDGEPHLAGTAKADVAYLSGGTASRLGLIPGDVVAISGPDGSLELPMRVSAGMVDDVVWVPARVDRRSTAQRLGAGVGSRVRVTGVTAKGATA